MEMYDRTILSSDHLYLSIGRNIRHLRKKKNLTQEQLAELIDGDQKYISRIESGKAKASLLYYLKIANALCVSLDYLLIDCISAHYGLEGADDLFQNFIGETEEQLANAPTPISGSRELRLGDILYRDLNGDGKITTDDATWISNSNIPEMMFALNFDANYKGFDLSLQFQGAALNDKMLCGTWNNGASDNTPLTKPFYGNYDNAPVYLVEGSWTPDNTDAEYPRLSVIGNPNNSIVSTFWKRNGAYLRLKNITLGYTIPKHIINKAGLQNLRVYVAGSNLFTITDFKYLDPESPNVVQGYYPQQKTMSFGVDISF